MPDTADDLVPLLGSLRTCARGVENGTYLVNAENGIHFCVVELKFAIGIKVAQDINNKLGHLSHFLLQGHACECFFNFSFNSRVARDSRTRDCRLSHR